MSELIKAYIKEIVAEYSCPFCSYSLEPEIFRDCPWCGENNIEPILGHYAIVTQGRTGRGGDEAIGVHKAAYVTFPRYIYLEKARHEPN